MRYRIRYGFIPLSVLSLALLSGCVQPQDQGTPSPVAIGPNTLNVADAAIAGGDPDMALSVSQSVLATDPNNPDALIHEGDAYYALGRCPASQAAYQLALNADPKSSPAETGLARCLLKTDPKLAEAALALAVQDDPGNAAAFNDLDIARDLQGNFAGAVAPYRQALVDDPSLTAAEVNLGLSLALSGNGAAALQYLGPLATGQDATPKIREDYAAALVASGRDADARQVLSVDLAPDEVDSALEGFNAVIAGAQAPLAPAEAASPPTTPQVQTASISAAPLTGGLTMDTTTTTATTAPATPPPAPPTQSAMAYTPDNSTAAYTGPSPIPVTASSSEGGPPEPAAMPPAPAATPAVAPAPPPPVAAAIADAPSPATAPAAAAQVAPPATPSGSIMVQLAALDSQSDAERAWSKISSAMPALFGTRQPDIENAVVKGKTYFRLRTGGFDNEADAAKFCGEVSAAGNTCTVARF